jgi:hypothetical protein
MEVGKVKREDFALKIRDLISAPNDSATAIWIDWAEEMAGLYAEQVKECEDYIRENGRDAWIDFCESRITAEANLQDLHAAFYGVHQKYGGELSQLLYMQAPRHYCMYPSEFILAAEYLYKGGSIDQLGQRCVDGEFESDVIPGMPESSQDGHCMRNCPSL